MSEATGGAHVGRAGRGALPDGARPLASDELAAPAPEVAPRLVGRLLVVPDEGLACRVVEVEAYTEQDPACHASRGMTAANASLFAGPGTAYVYRAYGLHWLLNVATGAQGAGEGCLLRAAEPLAGVEVMRARRRGCADRDLLRGPGRLAEALGIDGRLDGGWLLGGGPVVLACDGGPHGPVEATPRTGVSRAADRPWRFVLAGSRWASPQRRSPRAR